MLSDALTSLGVCPSHVETLQNTFHVVTKSRVVLITCIICGDFAVKTVVTRPDRGPQTPLRPNDQSASPKRTRKGYLDVRLQDKTYNGQNNSGTVTLQKQCSLIHASGYVANDECKWVKDITAKALLGSLIQASRGEKVNKISWYYV